MKIPDKKTVQSCLCHSTCQNWDEDLSGLFKQHKINPKRLALKINELCQDRTSPDRLSDEETVMMVFAAYWAARRIAAFEEFRDAVTS